MINKLMRFYAGLEKIHGNPEFGRLRDELPQLITQAMLPEADVRIGEGSALLAGLPELPATETRYESSIHVRANPPPAAAKLAALRQLLVQFKPCRKGPYDIHGVH